MKALKSRFNSTWKPENYFKKHPYSFLSFHPPYQISAEATSVFYLRKNFLQIFVYHINIFYLAAAFDR